MPRDVNDNDAEQQKKRREDRYRALRLLCASERVRADKCRPGQIQAKETPMILSHRGSSFTPFTADDYILYDLHHNPSVDGMACFRFTAEDGRRIYAATIADTVRDYDGAIEDWHVEFYEKPSLANAEILRIGKKIDRALAS